jgi:hypothetical protein
MRVAALALLALAACGRGHRDAAAVPHPAARRADASPAPVPEPVDAQPQAPSPIALDWDLTRAGNELHLHYTVHNESDQWVVLLDRLLFGEARPAFDRVIVRDGDSPGVVSLVRGDVGPPPGVGVQVYERPAVRALAPGKRVSGDAVVALPVTAWHNYVTAWPLTGTPTRAYLEIGYLVGDPLLDDATLDAGTAVELVSRGAAILEQRFVRSDTRDLP